MAEPAGAQVVGDLLPEQAVEWTPALSGMGEDKIVSIHNPLSQTFRVQYARSMPYGAPPTENEKYTQDKTGLSLAKQGSQKHAIMYIELKPGETRQLPGDIAQIAVRKLVTHILSQRGDKNNRPIVDPQARKDVESEIIMSIRDTMDLANQESIEERTERQIKELNKPVVAEPTNPAPGTGMTYDPAA